jgi:hypothetical protein
VFGLPVAGWVGLYFQNSDARMVIQPIQAVRQRIQVGGQAMG